MGQSTDATIFYGILLDTDGCECIFNELEDIDERYGNSQGWVENNGGYFDKAGMYADFDNEQIREKARRVYKDNRDALNKITEKCQVSIGQHCSGDYPMHYVEIKQSVKRARRGYPMKIVTADVQEKKIWDTQLNDYCKAMGLKYKKPSWCLVSYWG